MTGKPGRTKRRKRATRRHTIRANGKKAKRATSRRTRCHRVARSKTRSRPTRRRIKTIRKMRNRKPLVRRTRRPALSGGVGTTHLSGRGTLALSGRGIKSGTLIGSIVDGAQQSVAQSDEVGSDRSVNAITVAESGSTESTPMINYAGEVSSTQNTADPEGAGIKIGSTFAASGVIRGLNKGARTIISKIKSGVKGFKGSENDVADDVADTSDVEGATTASDIASGSGNGDDSDDDGGSDEAGAESGAADSASSAAETAAAEAGVGFM